MADQSDDQFDFYDWAGLYQENPQEFEARRSAALMIELTRGSAEQCAAGRAMLEAYEKRVKGCNTQERLQVASSMMMESAMQLGTELSILKQTIENLESQKPE
ncbi:MAG: hypothetical protein AB8B64_10590 [Granulosicoccus sp.]